MAGQDLDHLAKRMAAIAAQVNRNAPKAVARVASALASPLVFTTPVDTSRARANWQAGVGVIPTNILYAEPDKPPTADEGGNLGVASIQAAAARYGQGGGNSYIAIANNVPYILKLNNVSSGQAPANFVQISIMVGLNSLKGFRILNGN